MRLCCGDAHHILGKITAVLQGENEYNLTIKIFIVFGVQNFINVRQKNGPMFPTGALEMRQNMPHIVILRLILNCNSFNY